MSKYIIELDDTTKAVQKIAVFDDGRIYTHQWEVEDLEELNSDYINEHFGDLQDEAYKRGSEDGKGAIHKGCEGCKYEGTIGMPPCVYCSNNFPNQWTAESDKIEVGDEIERYINGKLDATGIYLGEDGDYWNCLFWTGSVFGTFAYPKNQFKKTGRHFDITDMLKGALK